MKRMRKQLFAVAAAAGLAVAGLSAAEHAASPTAQIGYVLSEDYGVPFVPSMVIGLKVTKPLCGRSRACLNLAFA